MLCNKKDRKSTDIRLVLWFLIAAVIIVADYFAGPYIHFPVTYIIPIAFVSWCKGRFWGIIFSITMSLFRLYFSVILWVVPGTYIETGLNFAVSVSVFALLATLFAKISENNRKLSEEVDVLSGLLPICSNCKKIKNDSDDWEQVESYISKKSSASFTHGLCPECKKKLYGAELQKLRDGK